MRGIISTGHGKTRRMLISRKSWCSLMTISKKMYQKVRDIIMPPISNQIQSIQYPHGRWTGTETSIKRGRTVQRGRQNDEIIFCGYSDQTDHLK